MTHLILSLIIVGPFVIIIYALWGDVTPRFKRGLRTLYTTTFVRYKLWDNYVAVKNTNPKTESLIKFKKHLLAAIKDLGYTIYLHKDGSINESSKLGTYYVKTYSELVKLSDKYMDELAKDSYNIVPSVEELQNFVKSYDEVKGLFQET